MKDFFNSSEQNSIVLHEANPHDLVLLEANQDRLGPFEIVANKNRLGPVEIVANHNLVEMDLLEEETDDESCEAEYLDLRMQVPNQIIPILRFYFSIQDSIEFKFCNRYL